MSEEVKKVDDGIDYGAIASDSEAFLREKNFSQGPFPLIFPSFGTVDLKLFVNPNTPSLAKKYIIEHKFDNNGKFPCMSNFGKPCDFCFALSERGQLWRGDETKLKKQYYLMYAILVDHNFTPAENDRVEDTTFTLPEKGSIVVVKIPLGAYLKIAEHTKDTETARKILGANGSVIQIENSPSIKYRYGVKVLTETYDANPKIKEHKEELISLEDFLYGKIPSDELISKIQSKTVEFNTILDSIIRRTTYKGDDVGGGKTTLAPSNPTNPTNPSNPTLPIGVSPAKNPDCFGMFSEDKTLCFTCGEEEGCRAATISRNKK